MRVHRYLSVRGPEEDYFWCFCVRYKYKIRTISVDRSHTNRIILAKDEFQSKSFAHVDRVVIHDLDVHEPFLEVLRRHKRYAGGQGTAV